MKKTLSVLFLAAALCSSCSKDSALDPAPDHLIKISLATTFTNQLSSTWQQVLGGKAMVSFTAIGSEPVSVSSVADSLNLANLATYSKTLIASTYDVMLSTKSTAVLDTFIRFNAKASGVVLNADQNISLIAATTDGVITISKTIIGNNAAPTFTPAGSTTAYNFGIANGYYFIYVKGTVGGRITFTEAVSGDEFFQDLTVDAMNQYDVSAILNTNFSTANANHHRNFVIAKHSFNSTIIN